MADDDAAAPSLSLHPRQESRIRQYQCPVGLLPYRAYPALIRSFCFCQQGTRSIYTLTGCILIFFFRRAFADCVIKFAIISSVVQGVGGTEEIKRLSCSAVLHTSIA